jgi:hypothetical protein
MNSIRDILLVARRLSDDLGPEGLAIVDARAEGFATGRQDEDARFWRNVAWAMRSLDRPGPPAAP